PDPCPPSCPSARCAPRCRFSCLARVHDRVLFPYTTLVRSGLPKVGIVIDPMPSGSLVFTLSIGAYSSELFRAAILSIPKGQWERSDEHTSELQSRFDIVCRLQLAKKWTAITRRTSKQSSKC